MSEKFSFSKLNTFDKSEGGCPFKYKLTYVDKHFINDTSLANEFGTLVHFIEQTIADDIIANDNEPNFMLDDNKYTDMFLNLDVTDTNKVLGVNKLKEKYPNDFYVKDKYDMSYEDKVNSYLNNGIYRLRNFLSKNRDLIIIGTEKEFNLEFGDYVFHGYIDRIIQDTSTGQIYIEDIKTWSSSEGHNLVTPLQFVFYALAVKELYNVKEENISCAYDLPFMDAKVSAGTKGFIGRGTKKINKLLEEIKSGNYEPNPSPLCHWCVFSATNPNQPEQAKNLCPYYCLWTKTNKNFSPKYEWMGIENHKAIMEAFINDQNQIKILKEASKEIDQMKKQIQNANSDRIFLIRR